VAAMYLLVLDAVDHRKWRKLIKDVV